MSKAILVIDMPNSCSECPLFNDIYNDMNCRGANKRSIDYPYPADFRQEWCPLRKLPEKFDIEAERNKPHDMDCDWEFESGYNVCLEEILGE